MRDRKVYRRHYLETHRDAQNANSKRWRQDEKVKILKAYGGKCVCCGEDKIEFLSIDHIYGNGNKHRLSLGGNGRFYSWLRRNNFPDGFRVLCMNCNFALGKFGYCPHGNIRKENREEKIHALPLFS